MKTVPVQHYFSNQIVSKSTCKHQSLGYIIHSKFEMKNLFEKIHATSAKISINTKISCAPKMDELKCSNGILAYAQCLVFRGKIQTKMQLRFDNL